MSIQGTVGKDWDGTVDVLYMTRRQRERENRTESEEAQVPCPHCGQFITIGIIGEVRKGKSP